MARCPYCFKTLPENGICGCNYENNNYYRDKNVLRPGTMIAARYRIGAVMSQSWSDIYYHGFDYLESKDVMIREFFPKALVIRESLHDNSDKNPNANRVVSTYPNNENSFQEIMKLFISTARTISEIEKAPNLPKVYLRFRENGTAYMAMEYIEGKSLKDLLSENGPFSEKDLVRLLDPILDSLQKIHENRIVCRNISPENIIVDPDGKPVLIGFGIPNIEIDQKDGSGQITSKMLIVPKNGFTPAEQLLGDTDVRSDIYSLGASYYYLLTCRLPHDASVRMSRDQVQPLSRYGISAGVSDAVMKAMAVRPEDRWSSISEFRNALNEACSDLQKPNPTPAESENLTDVSAPVEKEPSSDQVPEKKDAVPPDEDPKQEPDNPLSSDTEKILSDEDFGVGNIITFGVYGQSEKGRPNPIEWRVLAEENGRALLISRFGLKSMPYHNEMKEIIWDNCTLRAWLNGEFYNDAFNAEEKNRIAEVTNNNPNNERWNTEAGEGTKDRIFLLSIEEAAKYFSEDRERQCIPVPDKKRDGEEGNKAKYNSWWWLRSPGYSSYDAAFVGDDGYIYEFGDGVVDTSVLVRPALWLIL